MLDIHPEPAPWRVIIRQPDGIEEGMGWSEEPVHWERVVATREGRDELIATGVFTRAQTTIFPYRYHFDTVEHWLHHMQFTWSDQRVDPAVVARAKTALQSKGGELILEEQVQAMLMRRS